MQRPVLIVLHQERSTPGRVGQALLRRGYPLDIRRPALGDPLPPTLAGHSAAVVFGGPMSANDPDDFIRREIDWISVPLAEETPFLGICLGAQMLVRQLGGRVAPHPEGRVEVGYYPLEPTESGRRMMDWPGMVYQWHREGMEPPAGVELLARGDTFEWQAFRAGTGAYGLQFHPEMTLAMMHRWTVRGAHRLGLPGARPRRAHFEARAVHDAAVRLWLEAFLDAWLAGGARTASGAEEAVSDVSPAGARPRNLRRALQDAPRST